jgi:PRTRC genetic system protein C
MPELDPRNDDPAAAEHIGQEDDEDLAAAYEALDEDRRRQAALAEGRPLEGQPGQHETEPGDASAEGADEPAPAGPTPATGESAAPGPPSGAAAAAGRRVFIIDGKEYPDPDADLPIAGPRSVQALYRDYFPGQLDNADVAQKTRADGTLEVTFKRRIGTKGARPAARPGRGRGSGEVLVTVPRVVSMLAGLPVDRPLVWDLVEQAFDRRGAVRLDYVPPPAQLNLAEAQHAARVRLIEHAVGELHRLRPSG